jgi:histone demethylase JARID1
MGRKGLTLEEAPVFHPSEEEFQNALLYIASIREQAEPYGLCRIVPPSSWQPPFALPAGWKFKTKVQKVHHLQERQGVSTCQCRFFIA